jgi:hypothetical protein
MDMSPDPYEIRLYKLSVKSKNSPIGVRMKSWQPLQLGSILQSESNILAPKVMWWSGGEYWEDLGLVPNQFFCPPYFPCNFHARLYPVK